MKKLFSVVMVLVLLAGMVMPCFAAAEEIYQTDLRSSIEKKFNKMKTGYTQYSHHIVFINELSTSCTVTALFLTSATLPTSGNVSLGFISNAANNPTKSSIDAGSGFLYENGKIKAGTKVLGYWVKDLSTALAPWVEDAWRENSSYIVNLGIVTYTALQSLINQADQLTGSEYTEDSWQTLQEALERANDLITVGATRQDEIDTMCDTLKAAINGLVKPDYTSLQALIDQADRLADSEYTAGSWRTLQRALESAKSLITTGAASQSQIDEAGKELQSAIDGLKAKPILNYTKLQALIVLAEQQVRPDYTPETWAALRQVVAAAKSMIESGADNQKEVNALCDTLHAAIYAKMRLYSDDTLTPIINIFVSTSAVLLPVAIVLFALMLGVLLIPQIIRRYTKS